MTDVFVKQNIKTSTHTKIVHQLAFSEAFQGCLQQLDFAQLTLFQWRQLSYPHTKEIPWSGDVGTHH